MLITFPTLPQNQNYNFIGVSGEETFVIDPSVFEDVEGQLKNIDKKLNYILITHHHWDHIGGVDALIKKYQCKLIVPKNFPLKKNNIFRHVGDGDEIKIGEYLFTVIDVPGHTKDHVLYHDPKNKIAFVGDALFNIGCGRNFEGTFEEFTQSLWKIYQLPDETMIHCAHEYTKQNLRFALSRDPHNFELRSFANKVDEVLKSGSFTVPFKLLENKKLNPFLCVFHGLESPTANVVKIMKSLRMQKDKF